MIILDENRQKDFLSRKWVEKLIDLGIDVSGNSYILGKDAWARDDEGGDEDIVWIEEMESTDQVYDAIPTFTVSELYAKLGNNSDALQKADFISKENNMPLIEALACILTHTVNE